MNRPMSMYTHRKTKCARYACGPFGDMPMIYKRACVCACMCTYVLARTSKDVLDGCASVSL